MQKSIWLISGWVYPGALLMQPTGPLQVRTDTLLSLSWVRRSLDRPLYEAG